MSKHYTMIGSRKTPNHILELMRTLADRLAREGWIGRSGGAEGADQCLEDGCDGILSARKEVYLPWEGFNGKSSDDRGYINPSRMSNYPTAKLMAEGLHPAWDRCSKGAKTLHTRNVYQVLGKDLKSPSKFLICYAEPKGTNTDEVKGGTGTAVKLGIDNGVRIINLYYEESVKLMRDYINKV